MIQPGIYNITCPQGATFNRRFTYSIDNVPVNLGSYTAALQVRESYDIEPVISLTNLSGIVLGGTAGTIDVTVAATATAAVPAGQYLYDLELNNDGEVTRLLQGVWNHTPEVTK